VFPSNRTPSAALPSRDAEAASGTAQSTGSPRKSPFLLSVPASSLPQTPKDMSTELSEAEIASSFQPSDVSAHVLRAKSRPASVNPSTTPPMDQAAPETAAASAPSARPRFGGRARLPASSPQSRLAGPPVSVQPGSPSPNGPSSVCVPAEARGDPATDASAPGGAPIVHHLAVPTLDVSELDDLLSRLPPA
jgi:hypothetical protein